jgi:C2H2-type zinc finger/Zinc finger, C2H2 type
LIKFNDYDEHKSISEQIQADILGLMDNKLVFVDEEDQKIKVEQHEDSSDAIEYEPFEGEDVFVTGDEELEEQDDAAGQDDTVEAIEEDYHFEIVVDDTKENVKKEQMRTVPVKLDENNEFIVIELENNQRVYQCDICFKTCKDRSKLRTHREIHTEERNIICPVCGKAFKTMNCLRNHKRLHVPDRTYYSCDLCEKKYTQKVRHLNNLTDSV